MLKNSQGSMFYVWGGGGHCTRLSIYNFISCALFVCLCCGLVSTPPTFTLLEVMTDDLMFLEVPDGVHTFELHWIESILSF
jgi:hypothetical protein